MSSYDKQIVRQELFTGGNKTRNNAEKWEPQLVFVKQLMLLAVGKSARGQNPSLVLLSLCMCLTLWVSHCVKKEHIQMCMAIKC